MRVLAVTTDAFGGHGGIALYTRNLLCGLCTHPAHPRVVAVPRAMPLPPEEIPPNLAWDTSGLGGKRPFAKTVLRAAAAGPVDLVLCTHVNLLTLAYPIARLRRAPIVLVVYGIEAREPRGRPLAKRFTSRVDAVISIRRQTTRTLASWAKLAATQTYLLENAIDLSLYGAAPKDPKLVARFGLAGKRVVMTMSRLGEQYVGIDEVLGALPAIAAESPDIVYLVAGEGPDLPRLRDKARALGVANRVVFAGFVPELRKADYYRLADAYAMPGSGSDFDRYPLRFGFLEAMACGIPVVGAVCEDEEERRADGGLLARQVDPHDSRAIAQGILEALAMPKAIPAGLERFGFPAFERRLHAVVDEIMARARRSSGSSALSLPKAAS